MIQPLTSGGLKNLSVASTTSQSVMIHMLATLMSVPMISARCHPYERLSEEFLCASQRDTIEMAKPRMSEPKCAESAYTAIELAR